MFDVTIVAAVTIAENDPPYTISHVYRLDLAGCLPEDLAKFINYIKAYRHVAALDTLTAADEG